MLFKMMANQSNSSLNRGLSSNFWQLKSANHMKFKEECGVGTEKHVLVKEFFFKWVKRSFATTSLSQKKKKTVHDSPVNKKFPGAVVSKRGDAYRDIKGPIAIDFLETGALLNSASYWKLLRQNSSYLLTIYTKQSEHISFRRRHYTVQILDVTFIKYF